MVSTADTSDRGHPIVALLARFRAELGDLCDQSTWSMTDTEIRKATVEITRLEAQVAELGSRVLADADRRRVGNESGATSTANWLAHQTRLTRREAHARVRLAHSVDAHDAVRADLAGGTVLPEQAQVIVEALDALPDDLVDAATVVLAEKTLLTYAADHDAKRLRILGRRIMDVVAPEVGEAHTARELEREERDAAAAARFTMSEDGHGKWPGPGPGSSVGTAVGSGVLRVRRALPRRPSPESGRGVRHRGGHHDPRRAARRPRAGTPRHRQGDLRFPGPTADV